MKVSAQNKGRFAMFEFEGHCIPLMNGYFDRDNPDKVEHRVKYDPYFDDAVNIVESDNTRKAVLNFWTEDLNKEYQRIKALYISPRMTEIKYICYASPYYYFHFTDLDGNIIEVTGPYKED
jgi:lactoylglutathione lyase